MSVFEDLKQIIVEIKDVPEEEIQLDSRFEEDLEADSLDVVEMLMLLEEKYDIQIPEEVAEKLKTVRDAVQYLEDRLNNK
ncbi:MAG: acyl carrier protein [Syntrophomonadaceae bacterium]|nr:acyl carrier protein [Syntrophomonadaceae bacterium]